MIFNAALTLVTNWSFYGEKPGLLGFCARWDANDGVQIGHGPDNVIIDNIVDTDCRTPLGEVWWIESRGCWASVLSPDVDFVVNMTVESFKRSDVVRQGNQAVYSSESSGRQISRLLSVIDLNNTILTYRFVATAGMTDARVWLTNNSNPLVYLEWHSALDKKLRGVLQCGAFATLETANVQYSVRWNQASSLGKFSTLDAWSGLSGGF
jgi:hypothetical protein